MIVTAVLDRFAMRTASPSSCSRAASRIGPEIRGFGTLPRMRACGPWRAFSGHRDAWRSKSRATILVCLTVSFAIPGIADGESLTVSIPPGHMAGKSLSIEVTGTADGSHRLFAFVEPWGGSCPPRPSGEPGSFSNATWLIPYAGSSLGAGKFALAYSFTPPADGSYPVCTYLDEGPEASPDATSFTKLEVPVGGVPPPGLFENMRQISIENEQRQQREAAQRRQEQEERERRPASELPQVEQSPQEATPSCVVPHLVGHMLRGARALLARAHCRLGKISRPAHAGGKLLVSHQGDPRGMKLPAGTAVAVRLRVSK